MADGASDSVGGSPGGLEIKATRDAIDIEDLSREVNAGEVFAFKGQSIERQEERLNSRFKQLQEQLRHMMNGGEEE